MQSCSSRRLKLLRQEAHACLHLARLTETQAERLRLRGEAARLAMQAEQEDREHGPALTHEGLPR
jgi:hypothetical protein